MTPVLILVCVTFTCIRQVLKTVREALKMVREAWDLWDRYVARKGVPGEAAPSGTGRDGRVGTVGRTGNVSDDGYRQLSLWP
jgi:hypothetical protein